MKKKVLAKLNKCYSIAPLTWQGKEHVLVAAEKADPCFLFTADGEKAATVWEGPGGVMTMAQVPGTDGQFLATHKFFSPNDSKEAKIVTATPDGNGGWTVKTLCDLPFVHRFDILTGGGETYLIACALKSGHEYKDDWSSPGKVYGALLPKDLSGFDDGHQLELTVLKDGLLKNHGYTRTEKDGRQAALIGCENGVFRFTPPAAPGGEWEIEALLDTPASDAVLTDLDGDGKAELLVISPFHGNTAAIYRQTEQGYEKVYEYPEKAEFLHAIWGGKLAGKNTVILGHRNGARRLMAFLWDEAKQDFAFKTLDDDCGPANVYGYTYGGVDRLVSANRETDEIAMYLFEEGDL